MPNIKPTMSRSSRLRHPQLLDFLERDAGHRPQLTRGNSDSLTYSAGRQSRAATERDKITVYSGAIYMKSIGEWREQHVSALRFAGASAET